MRDRRCLLKKIQHSEQIKICHKNIKIPHHFQWAVAVSVKFWLKSLKFLTSRIECNWNLFRKRLKNLIKNFYLFCKICYKRSIWMEKVSWFSLQILWILYKSLPCHLHTWRTAYRDRKSICWIGEKQIRKSPYYYQRTSKRKNKAKYSREWRKNEKKKSWKHNGWRDRKKFKQNSLIKNCETYRWCIL